MTDNFRDEKRRQFEYFVQLHVCRKYFVSVEVYNFFVLLQNHQAVFSDDFLQPWLEGVDVKTDEQRIQEVRFHKKTKEFIKRNWITTSR